MSQYVQADYIDTRGSGAYFEGDVTQIRGGSITWAQCGTWATWPSSRWSPGIGPAPLTLSASATGTKAKFGTATAQLTLGASATGVRKQGGTASASLSLSSVAQGNVKFGGVATGNLTLSASVLSAVMQLPFPHTTFSVPSETRIYVLPTDPDNRIFAIEDGETRVYPVGYESRTRTIESETRKQPTEVY